MSEPRNPLLGKQQQEELTRAAAEAMANLALVLPPFIKAMQDLAAIALPALVKAFEPVANFMKENGLRPGELEAAVRGEVLADEMADDQLSYWCQECQPIRRVSIVHKWAHNRICHTKADT